MLFPLLFSSAHYHIFSGKPVCCYDPRASYRNHLYRPLPRFGRLSIQVLRHLTLHRRYIPRQRKVLMGLCRNMGRAYTLHFSFFLHSPWTQFAEISNLHTHLTLRNLRPANTRKRAIPYGYGFSLVSCPNYFFEAVTWGVICVMTGSVAGTSFAACSLCFPPPPTLGFCSLRCSLLRYCSA